MLITINTFNFNFGIFIINSILSSNLQISNQKKKKNRTFTHLKFKSINALTNLFYYH